VKHVLQQHYPQYHDAALKSAIVKHRPATLQQRKLLELYSYRACAGAERAALGAKADQVVRISAKPIYVFQALVQYLGTHRVVAPGYSFLQDIVSRALGKERGQLTSLLDTRLDEPTRKALDRLYLERDGGYGVTPLKQDPKHQLHDYFHVINYSMWSHQVIGEATVNRSDYPSAEAVDEEIARTLAEWQRRATAGSPR